MANKVNTNQLHVQSLSNTDILVVRCDKDILPNTPEDAVAFVTGERYLSEHDAWTIGQFLIGAADQFRAAKERKRNLIEFRERVVPNLCKSCGHLNDPHKRGVCLCEHCKTPMNRGPFPGEVQNG
jgi:hypothetical protein